MRPFLVARQLRIGALAAALISALAGCGALSNQYSNQERDGGVGVGATVEAIQSAPGVADAKFSNVPWHNPGEGGLFSSDGVDVLVEIDFEPSVRLTDPGAALDALVEQAWATNADYPKGAVVIVFDGGVSANFDWVEVVEAGWGANTSADNEVRRHFEDAGLDLTDRSLASVSAQAVADRSGQWPGEPPAKFTLDVAEGIPASVLVPALEGVSLHIGATQPVDCWEVQIDRSWDTAAEYQGRVGIELFRDGEPVESLEFQGGASTSSDDFCGFSRADFDATTFTVVATPLDGADERFDLTTVSSTGWEPKQ